MAKEEESLHASLHPEVERVLRGKNLLLWKKLLQDAGYKDLQICDEIIRGVRMTGAASFSEEMAHGAILPTMTEQEVRGRACWWRRAVVAKCQAGDPELDKALWAQTLQEVEKGWLQGPMDEAEVTVLVGHSHWLATRRFPLQQRDKVRVIDDALESGLNASYSCPNKLRLHDLDTLTALALLARSCLDAREPLELILGDGNKLVAEKAHDWPADIQLQGRCLDLSDAYKQLAVDPTEAWSRVLVAYCPATGKPSYFMTRSLMFGSTSSVYAFNRISRSLWFLGQHYLWQWSTNYYDDYPSVETALTSGSARTTMEGLLDELGWDFARDGRKACPYSKSFEVLGAVCDLSGGQVVLANKPSRVAKVVEAAEAWLTADWIGPSDAASMQGVLNFAHISKDAASNRF